MKARIKATGEIVDVTRIIEKYVVTHHPHTITFEKDELDFDIEDDPDYWTRLEHQYAGMAMQGLLSNEKIMCYAQSTNGWDDFISNNALVFATALVEKLKEKEERK